MLSGEKWSDSALLLPHGGDAQGGVLWQEAKIRERAVESERN